ncbi:MAG: DUF721 domain-containing protein [Planctomycetota bacterium]
MGSRSDSDLAGSGRRPRHLSEAITELFATRWIVGPVELGAVRAAWERIAGGEVAQVTRVAAVRNDVLVVETSSSARLFELEAFHSARLLAAMKKEPALACVRRIRFEATRV